MRRSTAGRPTSPSTRGVESGTNVVAHSPVDRNVEPARSSVQVDVLDRAHPVKSKGAGSADRPTGLDRQAGHGDSERPAFVVDDVAKGASQLFRRGRGVSAGGCDTEAPPRFSSASSTLYWSTEIGVQPKRPPGGDLEPVGVENLGADVGVDAQQFEMIILEAGAQRFRGATSGDGEAELLILVRGGNVLVGVRLNAGRDSHEHARPDAEPALNLLSRAISSNESTTTWPTPASSAAAISSWLLLLP